MHQNGPKKSWGGGLGKNINLSSIINADLTCKFSTSLVKIKILLFIITRAAHLDETMPRVALKTIEKLLILENLYFKIPNMKYF